MNSISAFQFQKFTIKQEHCAMKIGIDSVLLGAWCPKGQYQSILDIGTGTGVLSLMLAQINTAKIDAIEINETAFNEAKSNISESNYSSQITVHHSSLQEYEPQTKYDLIISNPPYFNATRLSKKIDRNTARHQTKLSFEDLLYHSKRLLHPDGQIVFILPTEAQEEIAELCVKLDLHIRNRTLVYGKVDKTAKRCLFIVQQQPCETLEGNISIRTQDNKYSPEFYELTKDYYLPSIFR